MLFLKSPIVRQRLLVKSLLAQSLRLSILDPLLHLPIFPPGRHENRCCPEWKLTVFFDLDSVWRVVT